MHQPFLIDQLPGRTIAHDGQTYLFFSGTAYLGLPQLLGFQKRLAESLLRYGSMYGSSRNGNVQLAVYEKFERKLADTIGTKPQRPTVALTVSSGMLAGQVAVQWLRTQPTHCLYAPHTHPALWHEPRVGLPNLSFSEWADTLNEKIRALPPDGAIAILTNSIDAVRSETYSFEWLKNLPANRPITVVIDDSHGVGVLNGGWGIGPQLQPPDGIRCIVTASLAKAMGLPGGVILSDPATISTLRHTGFFGGCSPIPPAYADAYGRASAYYKKQYRTLCQRVQLAEELLLPTGLFRQAGGYPVFYTQHEELYGYLLEKGILIYSFTYPTVHHPSHTRIVISAFHRPADIRTLAAHVQAFANERRNTE